MVPRHRDVTSVNAKKALLACRQAQEHARRARPSRATTRVGACVVINKHSATRVEPLLVRAAHGRRARRTPEDISCVRDFVQLAEAITVADLQRVLQVLDTDDADTYGCLGTSGPCPKEEAFEQTLAAAPDEHGTSHVFGMGRR